MANNNQSDEEYNNTDRLGIDAFHWHEALDRIAFIMEIFDSVTCNHPVFVNSPQSKELTDLSNKVAVELARLYNKISKLDPFNPL